MAQKKEAAPGAATAESAVNAAEKVESGAKSYYDEPVEMMIPRDVANPQDSDASITVNGKTWLFQRGQTVRVPRYVYLTYLDSESQKAKAYGLAQEASDKNS